MAFKLTILAAMSKNRVIGKQGKLPWHIPDDLRRFKKITTGNVCILGSRTFQSLGNKPLPNRSMVVLTSDTHRKNQENVWFEHSCINAIKQAQAQAQARILSNRGAFVIGGGIVYQEFMKLASTPLSAIDYASLEYSSSDYEPLENLEFELDLTIVHKNIPYGDAYFPEFKENEWNKEILDDIAAIDDVPAFSHTRYRPRSRRFN